MSQKIARWLREIKIEPPKVDDRPHVVQHLFKVSPPMEFTRYVAYRNGRLVRDPKHGMPNRSRVMSDMMQKARERGEHYPFFEKRYGPLYQYSARHHETSFVIASASDLKTYMEASRRKMVEFMKERGDKEGVALFSSQNDFEVETYLFPATKFGEIKNLGELEGSQRGTLDHRVPFQDVGYKVIGMPRELTLVPLVLTAAPFEEEPQQKEEK